jgi:hypothetical protein
VRPHGPRQCRRRSRRLDGSPPAAPCVTGGRRRGSRHSSQRRTADWHAARPGAWDVPGYSSPRASQSESPMRPGGRIDSAAWTRRIP